ncbi:MAG: ArsR/SmtB family transcription factor [Georgenia sp.]
MSDRTAIGAPIYELKAELFKALSHPVRIRTLELLATGDKPVSELLADMGVEASHLSQHLAVLRRAGAVTKARAGNVVTYALADPSVAEMLAVARTFLVHRLGHTSGALAELTDELADEPAGPAPTTAPEPAVDVAPAQNSGLDRVDVPDELGAEEEDGLLHEHIAVYRFHGALFFGGTKQFLDEIARVNDVKVISLALTDIRMMDASGANALSSIITDLRRRVIIVLLKGLDEHQRKVALAVGVLDTLGGREHYFYDLSAAVAHARNHVRLELERHEDMECAVPRRRRSIGEHVTARLRGQEHDAGGMIAASMYDTGSGRCADPGEVVRVGTIERLPGRMEHA